jgi:hypothetical protein
MRGSEALTAEDLAVTEKKDAEPLKLGDRVKIRNSGFPRGRIVEVRGPLGPGGKQVYRVRVRRKATPMDVEVLEDQLILIPAEK